MAVGVAAWGQPVPSDVPATPPSELPQAVPPEPPPAPPPFTAAANPALDADAAAGVARIALLDLRGIDQPTPDDFGVCGVLLATAGQFAPANTQIIRARVEAAHAAGDEAALLEATRLLVRADPKDTVAQLRLLSSRIGQMQTVQERLAAYRRSLGKDGARLDASIRSRLALDAALLSREQGDEKGFVEFLKQAASLDGTNKDAALLALSYFSERVADRRGHFELLANVLYADPLDPGIMGQVRDELASAAAWDQAWRFHRLAKGILKAQRDLQLEDDLADMGLTWNTEGPEVVLSKLNLELREMRDRQSRMFDQQVKDLKGFDMRAAEDVRLSVPRDHVRLAAAFALDDRDAVSKVVQDMTATNAETSAVLADPSRRPMELNEELASTRATTLRVELAVWKLLVEEGVPEVLADAPAMKRALGDDATIGAILDSWVALRTNNHAEVERIERESGVSSGWIGAALAVSKESRGEKKQAAAIFRAIAQDEPLTALGCWARHKADKLEPGVVNPLTAELARMARDIPLWIDAMIARPTQHQRLHAEVDRREARALERVNVTVSLKNLAPIPLSMGSDLPLNGRMLLIPSALTGEEDLVRRLSSEVLAFDHRLRLMPGEECSLSFDPSLGSLGWVEGTASAKPLTVRFRLLQGFVTGEGGARLAGPGSLDVSSAAISRPALDQSRLSPAALTPQIAGVPEAGIRRLAVATRAIMVTSAIQGATNADHEALAQAWADRYPTLSKQARLIALAELPPSGEVPAMKPFDDAAAQEIDPDVIRVVVCTRVSNPDDPLLARAATLPDSELARVAALHKARLTAGARVYAVRGVTAGMAAATESGFGR